MVRAVHHIPVIAEQVALYHVEEELLGVRMPCEPNSIAHTCKSRAVCKSACQSSLVEHTRTVTLMGPLHMRNM